VPFEPFGLRVLRSVILGAVAVAVAGVIGFVVPILQNQIVLVLLLVLVAMGAMLGARRIEVWVELHARRNVVVFAVLVVVVLPAFVLWLVQPVYIGPTH
jgi:hypothetical protein